MRNILVSGASIAGLTAAWWLAEQGHQVTVIERSPELRLGGQNIDVKGPARQVITEMGLLEAVRAANTTEKGLRFTDQAGRVLAEFPQGEALSLTQELEILRGDLVDLLYGKVKDRAAFVFADRIRSVSEDGEGLRIAFEEAKEARFDLLIIAEGIGSSTRNLVFRKEIRFTYLGLYTAYFTAERVAGDDEWARWTNLPGGTVTLIRPDNHGKTRICINFRSPERSYELRTIAEQKELLRAKVSTVPRLVAAIQQADDLYLERLSQVKAPRWSKGRVVLTGDAAWCVTPIGGIGTDLAIGGAHTLAQALSAYAEHQPAFRAYEQEIRPQVAKGQRRPPGVPGLLYPYSAWGVRVLNGLFRIAGSRPVKWVLKLLK